MTLYKNIHTKEIGTYQYFKDQETDDTLRFAGDRMISVSDYSKSLIELETGKDFADFHKDVF